MREIASEERNMNPYHHIDPGFINYRKCYSTFGRKFIELYNKHSNKGSDHLAKLENDHLMVDLALKFCLEKNVKSLGDSLIDPEEGVLISSTDTLEGTKEVYTKKRVRNRVLLPYDYDKEIYLEFGTEHFVADTGRTEQTQKAAISIIGQIRKVDNDTIIIYPLIMGGPTFMHPSNDCLSMDLDELELRGLDLYENFAEDIDEFSESRNVEDPPPEEWMKYMRKTSEDSIKKCFCEIISDVPKKDWGGEQDDIFSVSIHLGGKRVPTAFLLKGPSQFREMTPDLLGKHADQIYRLSSTPARLLVVQHCHSIGEAVRAMLRAFSVTPHDPRRYCLIDGKDTYKILKAYGKT